MIDLAGSLGILWFCTIHGGKADPMRMWKTPVEGMCRKHLLGEHVEMHMFDGSLRKRKNIIGYILGGLVETAEIKRRHDELAEEMVKRGYKHNSPMHENPVWLP